MSKKPQSKIPAKQGIGYGRPPRHSRFKLGESGNPAGRKPAGLYVKEHINLLVGADATESQLRVLAKDPDEPCSRRMAAIRILRSIESGDLADFEDLISGKVDLKTLREKGISTDVVKKFKQKSRVVPVGDGETEEVVEREIELHDRSGDDFDRILDRTIGKPSQAVDVTTGGMPLQIVDRETWEKV
jgi:hypothetical protein